MHPTYKMLLQNAFITFLWISFVFKHTTNGIYICDSEDCLCSKQEIICRHVNPFSLDMFENFRVKKLDFKGCRFGHINYQKINLFRNLQVLDVRNSLMECENFKGSLNFTIFHNCETPSTASFLLQTKSQSIDYERETNSMQKTTFISHGKKTFTESTESQVIFAHHSVGKQQNNVVNELSTTEMKKADVTEKQNNKQFNKGKIDFHKNTTSNDNLLNAGNNFKLWIIPTIISIIVTAVFIGITIFMLVKRNRRNNARRAFPNQIYRDINLSLMSIPQIVALDASRHSGEETEEDEDLPAFAL